MKNDESEFNALIVESMITDMEGLDKNEAIQIINRACDRLEEASEDFWEETDQGSQNIYYSPDKNELPKFLSYFSLKLKPKSMVSNVV
jgi:hypothetical protein